MPPTPTENELLDQKKRSPTCGKFENLKFSKKMMNFKTLLGTGRKKDNFWNQIFKNSRT